MLFLTQTYPVHFVVKWVFLFLYELMANNALQIWGARCSTGLWLVTEVPLQCFCSLVIKLLHRRKIQEAFAADKQDLRGGEVCVGGGVL